MVTYLIQCLANFLVSWGGGCGGGWDGGKTLYSYICPAIEINIKILFILSAFHFQLNSTRSFLFFYPLKCSILSCLDLFFLSIHLEDEMEVPVCTSVYTHVLAQGPCNIMGSFYIVCALFSDKIYILPGNNVRMNGLYYDVWILYSYYFIFIKKSSSLCIHT